MIISGEDAHARFEELVVGVIENSGVVHIHSHVGNAVLMSERDYEEIVASIKKLSQSRLEAFEGSLPGIFENYDFEADRKDAWGEQ